jgi:glutathione peroxidase
MSSIYDLTFKDTRENVHSLKDYQGKVLLLVNTATKCGFAPQFEDLETLHKEYGGKGLVVIGFPCNQFMGQEPETNETVVNVCKINFGVTFLLSEKIDVNGPGTHPIFAYLKSHSRSLVGGEIKWNFTKFLVSPDGETIRRYAPATNPQKLRPAIEVLLGAQNTAAER